MTDAPEPKPAPQRPITIGLVEDDPEILGFLSEALRPHGDLVLAFAASSVVQAREALQGQGVDVVVVDLGLPDGSGVDVIHQVRASWPRCEVLVSTQFGDEASVIAAFEAGATGYLLKQRSATQIADDIRQLHAGGSPISPMIARKLLQRLLPGREGARLPSVEAVVPAASATATASAASRRERAEPVVLSAREQQALELLAKGFTADEIAQLMDVSRNTVLTYVRRTYRKLDVSSKAEAIFEARQVGLVP